MSRTRPSRPPALLPMLAFACIGAVVACSSARPIAQPPEETSRRALEQQGMLITQEDILRSGAHTALEAVERSRSHLVISRVREGTPVKIRYRGIDSFYLSSEVLLVVDGSRVKHPVHMLRTIPAQSIRYIQILTGQEAALRFGSESGNGVIVVATTAR